MTTTVSDEQRRKQFLDELFGSGILVSTGVLGVYGASQLFEDIVEQLNRLITELGREDNPEVLRFPPVINRAHFEGSDYLGSFPQFAGVVFSFDGTPKDHMRLLDCVHEGRDWSEFETMTDVVITPAACYPVYPMAAQRGPVPKSGSLFDVMSYCFRHEPSTDPARLQIFRQREYVIISTAEAVVPWRDMWLERGLSLMRSLGLAAEADLANDPFFGRGGQMLAANQRSERLKFEILVAICSDENPTAIVSCNYHQDHFGTLYGIELETLGGAKAHTACIGFGIERIVLALLKTHGLDTKLWPESVQEKLWPS